MKLSHVNDSKGNVNIILSVTNAFIWICKSYLLRHTFNILTFHNLLCLFYVFQRTSKFIGYLIGKKIISREYLQYAKWRSYCEFRFGCLRKMSVSGRFIVYIRAYIPHACLVPLVYNERKLTCTHCKSCL